MTDSKTLIETNNQRWHLLDNIRGVCIILVVLYHVLYNLSELFGGNYAFFRSYGMDVFRDCFVSVLVLISGISCCFSRSNIKRGIKTFALGLVITAVTAVFIRESIIVFGILHFFGVAMLLYGLLGKAIEKIPFAAGFPICLLLFAFTYRLAYGFVGFFAALNLPLMAVPQNILLFVLGFDVHIFSADYYPLMPWIFMFLAGAFLGRFFKSGKAPRVFKCNLVPPLAFIGRHTLLIYMLHQPIIYAVMYLWFGLKIA